MNRLPERRLSCERIPGTPAAQARWLLLCAACLCAAFSGCSQESIETYRIPKPEVAAADAPFSDEAVSWSAPAGWQFLESSGMRYATYLVPSSNGGTADLSIAVFPGDAGGMSANVNRWRKQIGLTPLTPEQLERSGRVLRVGGEKAIVVDYAGGSGPGSKGLMGAIVRHGGQTWFFKLAADAETVRACAPSFLHFLDSVRFPGEARG